MVNINFQFFVLIFNLSHFHMVNDILCTDLYLIYPTLNIIFFVDVFCTYIVPLLIWLAKKMFLNLFVLTCA